ncbi:MAG: ECF transporter S component [Bacillales bacterium]|nr:ECF transporter S component [Bacillales bacterium]
MTIKTKKNKVRLLAYYGILSAITIAFAFILIPVTPGLPGITLTIIPVAFGAICVSPICGLFLGFIFGIVSFFQCFGFSAFGTALFAINPFFTFIVCVPTRMLVGLLTGLIFKSFRVKEVKSPRYHIGTIISNVSCALLNTVLVMGTVMLLFYNSTLIQSLMTAYSTTNVFLFVVLMVGINGLVEAVVCLSVGSILTGRLYPIVRKNLLV